MYIHVYIESSNFFSTQYIHSTIIILYSLFSVYLVSNTMGRAAHIHMQIIIIVQDLSLKYLCHHTVCIHSTRNFYNIVRVSKTQWNRLIRTF